MSLKEMIARQAQAGRLEWIGLRPGRREAVVPVEVAEVGPDGLEGDRARPGKRAVTLLQAEHLFVIGAFLGRGPVPAEALRRNLLISGINLLGLRGRRVQVGQALLEITGPCAPCSRMDEAFGAGGYAAVRGHGGMTARVLEPGRVTLHDVVRPVD